MVDSNEHPSKKEKCQCEETYWQVASDMTEVQLMVCSVVGWERVMLQ